jgi:hypothetical protein
MLEQVSSSELAEYQALERIDGPIGEMRADMRAGIVASAVVNHSMSPPKQPSRPVDFMPFAQKRDDVICLADEKEHAKLLARSLFGKLVR